MNKMNFLGLRSSQIVTLAHGAATATIKNSWISILYCSHRLAIYGILLAMVFCPETSQETTGKYSSLNRYHQDSWQSSETKKDASEPQHNQTIDLIKKSGRAESDYYKLNNASLSGKNKLKETNQLQDKICQIISELNEELKSFLVTSKVTSNEEILHSVPAKRRYLYRNEKSTIARRKTKEAKSAEYTIRVLRENIGKMKDLSQKVNLMTKQHC